jgi:antitoxin component YwqK of YwqJK toxin-antitoxin module
MRSIGRIKNRFNKEGEKHGYWEHNSILCSKGSYRNDKMEGLWEYYDVNGNLMSKGSYVNDEKDGIWEYYYTNGRLKFGILYNNGVKIKDI